MLYISFHIILWNISFNCLNRKLEFYMIFDFLPYIKEANDKDISSHKLFDEDVQHVLIICKEWMRYVSNIKY